MDGTELEPSDLAYVAPGRSHASPITAHEEARLLLLGGPPFGEADRDVVELPRPHPRGDRRASGEEWQAQIPTAVSSDGRFGVVDIDMEPIPAPDLPNVRLKLRH